MSTPDTTPAVELNKDMRVRLPVALLAVLIGAVVTATLAVAAHRAQVESNTKTLSDHTTRLDKLEATAAALPVIQSDIRWIRDELQRQRREGGK